MLRSKRVQGIFWSLMAITVGLACVMLFQTNNVANAQTSQACPVATEKPYRTANQATVYFITPECTKRAFFNPHVYLSFFADWNQVTFIKPSVLDAIPNDSLNFLPWGPRRDFRTGSLIKVTSDPTVYLLADGKAYPFEDEASFKSLGLSFNQIEDVAQATLAKYAIQSEYIRHAEDLPSSSVFKYPNDPKVYVLRQEGDEVVKEHITSTDELNALARADRIATLPASCSFANAQHATGTAASEPSSGQTSSSDAIPPSITAFTLPTLTSSRTVPILVFTSTDNVGVSKYLVRTSASKPGVNAYAWTSTPPTSFTFASAGTKTLYAWVKDAAGNISASATSTVIIDTLKPVVTFVLPTTSPSLTVQITQFTATDANGIGGYALTESGIAPAATDQVWSATAPTSYAFNAPGTKLLYAWAKDAAGNVSWSKKATVKITSTPPTDTVAPTVTAFVLPSTSASRTVSITSFTASDNVGVSGYLVTESASAPAVSASGWSTAPQTSYTFATDGSKTLYAWAKDAAGNVSTGKSATVAVSVPNQDTTAPTISSVASSTNTTSATITWTTNEPSTSVVEYGATTSYGSVVTSTSLVSSHSVVLSGLNSNTLYHFRIASADASGNVGRTGDYAVKTGTSVSTSTMPVGWLYTAGNKIYLSDGNGGGNRWMGRGVNMDDLFLCGYNSGLWMGSSAEQAFTTMASGLMSTWKPNFVRVSLGMNSYDQVSWTADPAQYKTPMTNIINSIGANPNTYVLVTVRSDASMGAGVDEATNYPITATDATYKALVNTFANSKFVMFGLSNEPGGNTLSNSAISSAMSHAISIIRAEEDRLGVPHHVIAVQGNSWTSEIGFYSTNPLPYDNIVYEVHGYAPETASYTYNNIPVIIGEYGNLSASTAPAFFADLESKQISSLAWDFEPYSNCAPDLLSVNYSSTNLVPTTWGKLVQNYLLSHAQ